MWLVWVLLHTLPDEGDQVGEEGGQLGVAPDIPENGGAECITVPQYMSDQGRVILNQSW